MSRYTVTNPATGEKVKTYPQITDAELDEVVTAAESAYRTWGRTSSIDERAAVIRKVADLHSERREELAAIIVREMGKPIGDALGEVDFAADIFRYYADNAHTFLADEPIELAEGSEGTAVMRTSPLGVLVGVMPWNFPYYQVARFAGPNVIVGNTIILKHASQCPESAAAIHQMFADAGAPVGVYTNVYASSEQIARIIADPRVQGVSLTGSEAAGSAVAEVAGRHIKKVVLELGGSDPFILLSTDDLDATVDSALAARLDNSGQSCNAAKRFIVIDELYDAFREKFTAKMLAAAPGDPVKGEADYGPLSSLGAAEGLDEQVQRAAKQGAKVERAGERDGAFFPPTVITDISPEHDAYREEFFGPVASLYRVSSEDEAIEVANGTPFGLGSYVFSTDAEQAARVADRIDAGMVYINVVLADSPELPFGGVKNSGMGRELGRFGANEFVNKKLIRTS
ncbi:MAG: NAD-dependent succinate-semialdehyde dehydrogenase [Cryobacterium sp.]|nr:NAD-dependent succinate-semialdehyde dehydrogenase [Cryobacterium sp.]